MKRKEILKAAYRCVSGDREQDYGSPEDNFGTIAKLWTAYLNGIMKSHDGYLPISGKDVAAMMILVKLARVASGHAKEDNWVDIAGYASCGGEIESGGDNG